MLNLKKSSRGFTLIELLVTVAIIGILSSIAIVSFSNASLKARDAKRKADLASLQQSLELYYDKTGEYPSTDGWIDTDASAGVGAALIEKGLLGRIPSDPKFSSSTNTYYQYWREEYCTPPVSGGPVATKERYTLLAKLEKPTLEDTNTMQTAFSNCAQRTDAKGNGMNYRLGN